MRWNLWLTWLIDIPNKNNSWLCFFDGQGSGKKEEIAKNEERKRKKRERKKEERKGKEKKEKKRGGKICS